MATTTLFNNLMPEKHNPAANIARGASARQGLPPLPGTINNLLENENDDATISLPGTPRAPPKDDVEPMPPSMASLPEQVDEFGWTLVAAIRDFRAHVEDVFAEHYQAMKRAEDVHRLNLAKLTAENGQLRERLGLSPGPQLYQNVAFQDINQKQGLNADKKAGGAEARLMKEINGGGDLKAAQKRDEAKAKDPSIKGAKNAAAQGLADDNTGLGRRAPPRGAMGTMDPLAGGGNWETFVAWVPAGAALQCPQPWKPLAHEAFVPVEFDTLVVEDDDEEGKKWKVLEMWEAEKDELAEMRKNIERCKSVGTGATIDKEMRKHSKPQIMAVAQAESDESVRDDEAPVRFIIHPHSKKRIGWDMGSLLLVLYDMVMIPMQFFELSDSLFLDVMAWITRLYWTFDMGMSLCTGIVLPNGSITFDFKFIVVRYLKTWFVLDVFIVASDWVEFIISQGDDDGGGSSLAGMARIFRIVRCVRLLRLVRMQSVMQTITERVQSDSLFFILKVLKLVIALVSFGHITACVWWGIGRRSGNTWSEAYSKEELPGRYLISLHWTLSQFSGGMEEVRPAAPIERFFVIVVWIVAFMAATIMASILTSSLVQAHIIGGSQARQIATLRKYLNQNSISKNLALRVQRSAKHAISGDLSPDAVDLLSVVSEQLRLEMHFEMYSELFRCHPFFDQCIHVCNQVMRRICHQATSTLLLDAGDILFSKGEAPSEPKMYFFFKGTAEYTLPSGEIIVLSERQWIAEPVLWLQWVHRGQLKAVSDIKVAKLDARRFQDIMERFKEVFPPGFNPKVYAHDYAQKLNDMPNADQVNDVSGLHPL